LLFDYLAMSATAAAVESTAAAVESTAATVKSAATTVKSAAGNCATVESTAIAMHTSGYAAMQAVAVKATTITATVKRSSVDEAW
jgi:hypothetical protein